jgi:hypothetical protein
MDQVSSLHSIPSKVFQLSETYQLGFVQKIHTRKTTRSFLYIQSLLCFLIAFAFIYIGATFYSTYDRLLGYGILCAILGILLIGFAISMRDIAYECSNGFLIMNGIMSGEKQKVRTILTWEQLQAVSEDETYFYDGKRRVYLISYAANTALKEEEIMFQDLWKRCLLEFRKMQQ